MSDQQFFWCSWGHWVNSVHDQEGKLCSAPACSGVVGPLVYTPFFDVTVSGSVDPHNKDI